MRAPIRFWLQRAVPIAWYDTKDLDPFSPFQALTFDTTSYEPELTERRPYVVGTGLGISALIAGGGSWYDANDLDGSAASPVHAGIHISGRSSATLSHKS